MAQQDDGAGAAAGKALLRSRIRASRAGRPQAERDAAGAALAARVLALPEVEGSRRVAVTVAMPTEPPTAGVIDALIARGVTVLAPRIEPEGRMGWVAVDAGTAWTVNVHGIREPIGSRGALDADVVLVPALAVAPDGRRLGQGGGYFDRALAGITATTIALVFDDEVLDGLPTEPHDRRVDVIVTPSRVLRVSRAPRA